VVSYPRHLPGFDYLGVYRYSLTFCTYHRRCHFTDAESVGLVLEHFVHTSITEHFAIPAYCFMPDHVHLLAEGSEDSADLKRFIKSAKQDSGFYFKQRTRTRLWQRLGFEYIRKAT
jgi:putative transposase